MQMNNAWGVCAFLRGMIRAAGTRAKPGRDRRATRTKVAAARKGERRAPERRRPEGNDASGRHDAAGNGERYSYVCWSMSTRDKADRSSVHPRPCSWPRRSSVTDPRSTVYGGSVTSTSK